MSTVLRKPSGYEFTGLGTIGKRLVNEFQRSHPDLCKPSFDPSYRYIRLGSPEQNLMLEKLVADVVTQDPGSVPLFKLRGMW
jgi:hypothetical protein